jgi:D-glycero-D-manno-heptose 1,7-bisphosphate phosphatase
MQRISNLNLNIAFFNENIDYLKSHKCVFLDRDGVVIEDIGYISNINDIKFVDGALKTLSYLKKKEYLIGIVTNQSGIARGFFTEKDFINFQNYLNQLLIDRGIEIDFVIACPYLDEGYPPYNLDHEFRKPQPGMINEVCKRIKIDKVESFLVGDRLTDIESAKRAGLRRSFLLKNKFITNKDIDRLRSDRFQIELIDKISAIMHKF